MDIIFTVLAAIALWRIILVGKQIMAARKHLTAQDLERYLAGGRTYPEEDRTRVTAHLGHCEACQDLMRQCVSGRPTQQAIIENSLLEE